LNLKRYPQAPVFGSG